jgi:phospholipase C
MGISGVEHVVILMLENRSFDEYFGTFPGANGFYIDPDSICQNAWVSTPGGWAGPTVWPYRLSTFTSQQGYSGGCNHGWGTYGMRDYYANGNMNGWSLPQADPNFKNNELQGNPVACMGYFAANDIPYHWWLAQNFALCDNYFCSVMGPTEPNRLYAFSGTIGGNATFLNNPPQWKGQQPNWPSYADLLTAAGISWTLYDETLSQGPVDEKGPGGGILNALSYFPSWTTKYQNSTHYVQDPSGTVYPGGAFKADASGSGNGLATVSWIIPHFNSSEHPTMPPWDGAVLISQVLGALLNGPYWDSTVLIVTYDENDGHFDHVQPPQPPATSSDEFINDINNNNKPTPIGLGFRVPTFVISPWTWQRGICSDQYDHTSILQFLYDVTNVECTNLSAWRQTFSSLSSIGFPGTATPVSAGTVLQSMLNLNLNSTDPIGTFQTNAIARANAPTAAATPICQLPTALPIVGNGTANGWQSTTSGFLVPSQQQQQSLWPPVQQVCQVIMTMPSCSLSQAQDQAGAGNNTATFQNAFIVTVDGFEPLELTTPNCSAYNPKAPKIYAAWPNPNNTMTPNCLTLVPAINITDESGAAVTNISWACTQVDLDPNLVPMESGVPQRFTFSYSLTFEDIKDTFNFAADTVKILTVNASFQSEITVTSAAEFELVTAQDPQFYHNFYNDTSWLSGELRVFSIAAGTPLFGGDWGTSGTDPLQFITSVINNLNANPQQTPIEFPPGTGLMVGTFDELNQDEGTNPLSLVPTQQGMPVFNFALARVHMQSDAPATNVRVFFRTFRMSVTDSIYEPTGSLSDPSAFRSNPPSTATMGIGSGDRRIPLLGVNSVAGQTDPEYVTIPFFATVRIQVDPTNKATWTTQGMQGQPDDTPNKRSIPGGPGTPVTQTFFGCWLDINQPSQNILPASFPMAANDWDGPWPLELPILAAFGDTHQCLVAELSFDPIQIPTGDTPTSSAWLAQRNLGFTNQ